VSNIRQHIYDGTGLIVAKATDMKLGYLKSHLKNDQTCKELFDACDEDKDGCLNRSEFINLSKALGANLTMNEM
jgi:Ca2+-binding EF-hand superfamily protein